MTEHDWQSFTQPINLNPTEIELEPLPVYDDPNTGTSLREAHIWSFDQTLAQVLDEGLTRMINFPYTDYGPELSRARDVFRAYAHKDECEGLPAVESKNSDEYADLMWALDWLKENFTGLWT